MTNDLIATVASEYHWCHVRNFAVSLSRSGYQGRRIVFAHNCNDDAIRNLKALNFEIVPFEKQGELTVQRHALFADWLGEHPETRLAMLLDARDLVVQTDPTKWLDRNVRMKDAALFGASECMSIAAEPTNSKWIRSLYGTGTWLELRMHDVLCAGSLIGEAQAVRELASAIWRECQRLPQWGSDQAALNYLMRRDFSGMMRIPRNAEGLILTCSWVANSPANMPRFRPNLTDLEPDFRDGVLYPKGSQVPFAIVHQYDRDPAMQAAITFRLQ